MDISRIQEYGSRIAYQSPSALKTDTKEVQNQQLTQKPSSETLVLKEDSDYGLSGEKIGKGKPDAGLEDILLSFKPKEAEEAGRNSDIKSLDVQKAISDMKKDQVLQQYQYFVGNSRNLYNEQADGVVIAKF